MMKVAIIGSGIAGLTANWALRQSGISTTIFESRNSFGMALHSIRLDLEGHTETGDVPSRMFNEILWPTLFRLYHHLGVEFEPVDPSQTFSVAESPDDQSTGNKSYLSLSVANRPIRAVKNLLNPAARRILKQADRLKREGTEFLESSPSDDAISLAEYLNANSYPPEFIYRFLYPTLSSTVCTCSYKALDQYPAKIILQSLHDMAQTSPLLKTKFGTHDVVERLTKNANDVRLQTRVTNIRETQSGVDISFEAEDATKGCSGTEQFDFVIVSTQANHALEMLESPSAAETSVLNRFQYEDVKVVLHTDLSLMPASSRDWATFNMILNQNLDSESAAMCSVLMNRFHSDWEIEQPVIQTINPIKTPDEDQILQAASLQRPVVSRASFDAWTQLESLNRQPKRRVLFSGSYATRGIPLLETGVRSSLNLIDKMGIDNPIAIKTSTIA